MNMTEVLDYVGPYAYGLAHRRGHRESKAYPVLIAGARVVAGRPRGGTEYELTRLDVDAEVGAAGVSIRADTLDLSAIQLLGKWVWVRGSDGQLYYVRVHRADTNHEANGMAHVRLGLW